MIAETPLEWRMATSAYLSPGPPPLSDQEEGVMNLVNPSVSQGYTVPREQVVGASSSSRSCSTHSSL